MRKEITLAIVFGFILGLLIVGGIWWTNKNSSGIVSESEDVVQQEAASQENNSPQTTDRPDTDSAVFVDIDSPDEGAIIDQDEVKLTGRTSPEAIVVLIYPEGETIVAADDQGNFEATALLVGGANEIEIAAYDQQGNQANALLTVVYSTAKL
ncbi:MAG: hypothetical protein PHU92_01045 [Candidatus Shapirobacteria bacterium]|nr:hypothetical protein [Candidatus Shapirobacteria bacterium]